LLRIGIIDFEININLRDIHVGAILVGLFNLFYCVFIEENGICFEKLKKMHIENCFLHICTIYIAHTKKLKLLFSLLSLLKYKEHFIAVFLNTYGITAIYFTFPPA